MGEFGTAGTRIAAVLISAFLHLAAGGAAQGREPQGEPLRIAQLVQGREAVSRHYPRALPSLLQHVNEVTTAQAETEPLLLESFADDRLFECPFVYVNFGDRADWTFSNVERDMLKQYLERGGFLFIDAGITAEFLRGRREMGQHHSFGEWAASPVLQKAFQPVFPGKEFRPLQRAHPIYRTFYEGLPDASALPDTVREFVVNEKWPDGTYSAAALNVKGRIAVLVTPIIAMGWGKNSLGSWVTTIRMRVREGTEGLSDYLQTAAYSGARYEVTREDGGTDIIYCQKEGLPAWVNEHQGPWRVFRYYGGREISDFAHVFYTRLGTNILLYALTH